MGLLLRAGNLPVDFMLLNGIKIIKLPLFELTIILKVKRQSDRKRSLTCLVAFVGYITGSCCTDRAKYYRNTGVT